MTFDQIDITLAHFFARPSASLLWSSQATTTTMMSGKLLVVFLLSLLTLGSAEKLSTGEDASEFIDKYIAEHDIMVFAKSSCKYCKNSKKVLDKVHKKSRGWNARFLYLDYMSADGPKIHAALAERTGQKTVPNVFIAGRHIGGNSELTEMYKSGELLNTVQEIAAGEIA